MLLIFRSGHESALKAQAPLRGPGYAPNNPGRFPDSKVKIARLINISD